jgi:serine/threonine protein kinase
MFKFKNAPSFLRSITKTTRPDACGRYGTVYRSPPYAIKVLTKERQDLCSTSVTNMVNREVCALTKLKDSKNVIRLYETYEDETNVYIVTELCERGSLLNETDLTDTQVLMVAKDIIHGLGECHRSGIIHGDVKPGNVVSKYNHQCKLIDFGHCRNIGDTMAVVYGSPYYSAPELFRAKGTVAGPEADVWSLGMMLYELLYPGIYPFGIERDSKVVFPPGAIVSRQLKGIINECLRRDPSKRLRF